MHSMLSDGRLSAAVRVMIVPQWKGRCQAPGQPNKPVVSVTMSMAPRGRFGNTVSSATQPIQRAARSQTAISPTPRLFQA